MKIIELFKKRQPRISFKKKLIILVSLFTFVGGLFLSVYIFNKEQRKIDDHFEVTFLDPHQAIVFWTSQKDTVGFVKYGAMENNLSMVEYQTSSVAGTAHAVVLNNIPSGGFYLSLHTESDSRFLWPEVKRIEFDPTTIE